MKTTLQIALALLAPSISIRTIWEQDPDCGPISTDCDGFDPSEDDDWEAWQSEVRATAIVSGEEISGSAYLGGTWEKAGDNPAESNPEISGYEAQMTVEALEDLLASLPENPPVGYLACQSLNFEIGEALEYLKKSMRESWEAQQSPAASL